VQLSSKDILKAQLEGRRTTRGEIIDLERLISTHPSDLLLRVKLLAFYKKNPHLSEDIGKPSRFYTHLSWLICNVPESSILDCESACIDKVCFPEEYESCRNLWWMQLESHPRQVEVYSNACNFLSLFEPLEAVRVIEMAVSQEPKNPTWRKRLAKQYIHAAEKGPTESSKLLVEKGLKEYEIFKQLSSQKCQRTEVMIAEALLNAGEWRLSKEYSESVIGWTVEADDSGNCRHTAHTLLGIIALSHGDDISQAEFHLAQSSIVNSGPVLRSFGPRLELANALLLKNRRLSVILFLLNFQKLWPRGRWQLLCWSLEIILRMKPCFECSLKQ